MKQASLKTLLIRLRICIGVFIFTVLCLFLFSFTLKSVYADIWAQLGMTKSDGEQKISNSIIGGYLDAYGVRNIKKIALGSRAAIAKDLLAYTKKHTGSAAFIKEYNALREGQKPVPATPQTPEQMRQEMIATSKKAVADNEATLKKAAESVKPIFEKVLEEARKQLKQAEDPNNKSIAAYRKNYQQLAKDMEAGNQQRLAEWESKYPANPQLFVKQRLQQFLTETNDIDFSAQLTEKNGKKYFVNKAYESKGSRWKMAFRAGKEVVEPARAFVEQWIAEIK